MWNIESNQVTIIRNQNTLSVMQRKWLKSFMLLSVFFAKKFCDLKNSFENKLIHIADFDSF